MESFQVTHVRLQEVRASALQWGQEGFYLAPGIWDPFFLLEIHPLLSLALLFPVTYAMSPF